MKKSNNNLDNITVNENKTKKIIIITSLVSFLVLIILIPLISGGIFFNSVFAPSKDLIEETISADGKYKVEAFLINGGATTDFAVRCYLKENNKPGKKLIYNDYHIDEAVMTWEDNNTININGHLIDLPNGKYDFRNN